MPRTLIDPTAQLGQRLGPKLAQLLAQGTIAAQRGLADTNHKLRVASARTVIDGIGAEFGTFNRLTLHALLGDRKPPPELQEILRRVGSGQEQWLAVAGYLGGISGAPQALGTIMSNYLAPTVRGLVSREPELQPDIGTIAGLTARGLLTLPQAVTAGAGLGYSPEWVGRMTEAAQGFPSADALGQAVNRGIITTQTAETWALRAGTPPSVIGPLLAMRHIRPSPADAALALLRGAITPQAAQELAAWSGLDPADLDLLVANTGEPPAIDALLSLWRRGLIDQALLDRGIRQSRVRDEWIPTVHKLAIQPPGQAEVIDALVEGQITRTEAQRRYTDAGGDPTWFQSAFNTRGNPPGPSQLLELANRGFISWTGKGPTVLSFEQGIAEGATRDKWTSAIRELGRYLPPPRTVVALVREDAITHQVAAKLLRDEGLTPDLADAYVTGASKQKVAKHKDLAVGVVETLYDDQAITRQAAAGMLGDLGYTTAEAAFILTVVDLRRAQKAITSAITHVEGRYVAHVITRPTASADLDRLGVPAGQRDAMLTAWDVAREASVKLLTQAEVRSAHKKGLLTDADALTRLEQMGYPPADAGILLQL